jgi:hypothetical protein
MFEPVAPPEELVYFSYSHLPVYLQEVSKPFYELAYFLFEKLPDSSQRAMALQHLLIAKDAAVRAHLRGERK